MDSGLFEGAGNVLGNILGAARDIFVAREETRQAEQQQQTAATAASALDRITTERVRVYVIGAVALAIVALLIYRRG